jgi:hypothetical protein
MLSTSHDRVRLRAGFGPAGAPDWVLSDRVAYGKPGWLGTILEQPAPAVAACGSRAARELGTADGARSGRLM